MGTKTDPMCATLGRGAPGLPGTPVAEVCPARLVRQMRHVIHVRHVCRMLQPRQVRHVRGTRRVCQVSLRTWQYTSGNVSAPTTRVENQCAIVAGWPSQRL
eukprot:5463203-Pyramimonas_sp.AAC.1